jgi:hypothetical protein
MKGCNVSPSPTDVSPTKNSWMLHPLDKVSLRYFAPDRAIPCLNSDLIERSDTRLPTAARFSAAKRWSSMCGPSVHPTEGRQSNKPGQERRRSRPDAPLIHKAPEADRGRDSGRRSEFHAWVVQGRDTLVRGAISKGCFVQVAYHPRIFGRGRIGRGYINPAGRKNGRIERVWRR